MRSRITSLLSYSDREPYLFRNPLIEPRLNWLSMVGSLATHALALGVVWLAGHLYWFQTYTVDWAANYRVEAMRLRVPEPIYFRPEPAPAARPDRQRPPRKSTEPSAGSGGEPASQRNPPRRPPVPTRFELPPARKTTEDAAIILQPDLPVPPKLTTTVPSVAFWARPESHLPKPLRRQFVIPGRAEAPSPPPNLDAPPVLAVPNREPVAGSINVAISAQPLSPPALPVASSATVPIRIRDSTGEPRAGSFDPQEGQPINVIAMGAERRRIGEIVEIPTGLQSVPSSGPGGTGGAGASTPAGAGQQAAGGPGGKGTAGPGAGPANAAKRQSGPPAGASGNATAQQTASAGAGAGAAAGRPGATVSLNSIDAAGMPAFTRIVHGPDNRSFDVVIEQSAGRDDLPETAGLLSGSPVYTVYLRVGDSREWLLEYCVPARGDPQGGSYQVDVGGTSDPSPPYPTVTVVPNGFLGQPRPQYIVLHGFITTGGRFRNVTASNADRAAARQILFALGQWEFRPALASRKPVELEILLIIPPRS